MRHFRQAQIGAFACVVLGLTACGQFSGERPSGAPVKPRDAASRVAPAPESRGAPETTTTVDLRGVLGGVMRAVREAEPFFTTTTGYRTLPPLVAQNPNAPTPVSSRRCDGAIGALIDSVFGPAGAWAQSIAARESGCTPTARNASGSAGLFQLFHHDDLLAAVCPSLSPSVSWADARCNTLAAYSLYRGSGTAPWRL